MSVTMAPAGMREVLNSLPLLHHSKYRVSVDWLEVAPENVRDEDEDVIDTEERRVTAI